MRSAICTTLTMLFLSFAWQAQAEVITPSDAQIVGIVESANSGEIQAAELASQNASQSDVKQFAQEMLTEHTAMQKEAQALAQKLGLKADDSLTSKSLRKKSESDLKKLHELQGAAFDKEYLGDQVTMHKLVLQTIEKMLIPSADNAELKAMLKQAQPKVAAHLQHAKQLKDKYDR